MINVRCPKCGCRYRADRCPICGQPAPEGYQAGRETKRLVAMAIASIALVIAVLVILIAGIAARMGEPVPEYTSRVEESVPVPVDATEEVAVTESATAQPGETTVTEAEGDATVIYSSGGVAVEVHPFEDNAEGINIPVTIRNESGRNIAVRSDFLSANGYMLPCSGLFAMVGEGKTTDTYWTLYGSDLQAAGIETIADMNFYLRIYDSDSFEDIGVSELITITRDVGEDFTQSVDDSGVEVYNQDGIRVLYRGLRKGEYNDGEVEFLIENTTDRNLEVYSYEALLDGETTMPVFWVQILPGTRVIDVLTFDYLDELGLESLFDAETLAFSFYISDAETWEEIAVTDTITISLSEE